MKKVALISIALFLAQGAAYASSVRTIYKKVSCHSPTLGYQVNVSGNLKLQPVGTGAFMATGKLDVQMGPVTPVPNPVSTILFRGQYDKIDGFEYATLGAEYDTPDSSEIDMLYIDFKDSSDRLESYIEMRGGGRRLLNCSDSR